MSPRSKGSLPLSGIRVLDLGRYLAGPYATMVLADFGAEVIKIETPGGNEDRRWGPQVEELDSSLSALFLSRGKKGITINLRSERGQQVMRRLVSLSDVVVENFAPRDKEALQLGYDALAKINPSIILVSISAFGDSGPYSDWVGVDPICQGLSGAMSFVGFPGNPPTMARIPAFDFGAALSASFSVMLALYHRRETGEGQKIELALTDTAVSFSLAYAANARAFGIDYKQIGNNLYFAFGDTYQAEDGWVAIIAIGNPIFKRLARIVGREDWISDPRFKDDMARYENRNLLQPVVAEWVRTKKMEEVVNQLQGSKIPAGPVLKPDQLVNDPRIRAREMLAEVDYPGVGPVPVPGLHIRCSKTPGRLNPIAPKLGEHNEEIFCGLLEMSRDEVDDLRRAGDI